MALYNPENDPYMGYKPVGRPAGTGTNFGPAGSWLSSRYNTGQPVAAPQNVATAAPAQAAAPAAPAAQPAATAPMNPVLDGLKHSQYRDSIFGLMGQLTQPVTAPVGMSDQEKQSAFNMARRQIQGATKAMQTQTGNQMMMNRGLRPGESGVADSAIGQIGQQGVQQLADVAGQIYQNDAQNRFQNDQALRTENLNRLLSAGKFGEILANMEQTDAGIDLNQQQLQYQQQQDALNMLMNYFGGLQNNQSTAWSPYWSNLAGMYQG